MSKILSAFKEFFRAEPQQTQIEKYLADSADLVDLENRIKQLKYKGIWV